MCRLHADLAQFLMPAAALPGCSTHQVCQWRGLHGLLHRQSLVSLSGHAPCRAHLQYKALVMADVSASL